MSAGNLIDPNSSILSESGAGFEDLSGNNIRSVNGNNGKDDNEKSLFYEGNKEEDIAKIDSMTVARLFNTASFIEKDTKITSKTLKSVSEYLRLFTCEAIVRANEKRIIDQKFNSNRYNIINSTVSDMKRANYDFGTNNVGGVSAENTGKDEEEDDMDDDFDDFEELPGMTGNTNVLGQQSQKSKRPKIIEDVLDLSHLEDIAGLLTLDF
ncbi:hypothetical protein B5S31_g3069 [[Candida] boidinii]|nr:hypothetical protein B5S31_g3069 [[Candida] boidinii]